MGFHIFLLLGAVAYSNAYYGQGTGPIVLDNLDCNGSEGRLLDCPYDPDTSDCSHFEDAGVMCAASPSKSMMCGHRLIARQHLNVSV